MLLLTKFASMSDTVVRVENLSKKYIIGHQRQERYTTLRDSIANGTKGLLKPFQRGKSQGADPSSEEFWALKDVSFEIKQGDRVGIIGRNGAGKEVGTGFHPELTGRENIFLNGAILGMGKIEIQRKFDEIVAFAEVAKFLDTPVKRYSSGMYVRLAFAVAAHLEPEILIVDEVLAVGDAQFQKKCLGKMEDVGKEGRTVLFVSHNMSAIQSLCDRCVVLQSGKLIADDKSAAAVQIYLQDTKISNSFNRSINNSEKPRIVSGKLQSINTSLIPQIQIDTEISTSAQKITSLDFRLKDSLGNSVGFGSLGTLKPDRLISLEVGLNSISFIFDIDRLAVGSYFISLDLSMPDIEYYDRVDDCLQFDVVRPPENGHIRVLNQSWRYGCYEIDLKLI
jgi:lipopolysaccharide transport system ATP-binding protein